MREIHGRRQKVILTLQTLRRLGVLLSGPSIYDKKSPVSLLWKIKIRMQSKNDFYNDIIFLIRTVTRVTTLSSEKCVQIPHNFTTILWPNISPCWDFQLLGVKLAWLITRCLYCMAQQEFSIQLHHSRDEARYQKYSNHWAVNSQLPFVFNSQTVFNSSKWTRKCSF